MNFCILTPHFLLTRKYYSPLSGYLGPLLLQYAETLHHLGRTEEAQKSAQVGLSFSDHQTRKARNVFIARKQRAT